MTAERKKPELLAPAGDWEKLQMAVLYGADAVYLAGTSFGMRSFAGNFSDEELPRAVDFAHRHGVKVHATVNTMPRSGEVDRLPEHLEKLNDAGVDALILADLGPLSWPGNMPPGASGTSAPSSPLPTMPAPRRGSTWGPSGWCWPGSWGWTRSGRSAAGWTRPWSWKPSATGPCACPIPGGACCPTI